MHLTIDVPKSSKSRPKVLFVDLEREAVPIEGTRAQSAEPDDEIQFDEDVIGEDEKTSRSPRSGQPGAKRK